MIAIRLAGSGGQGIQLAAVVLAEAAMRGGWNVACTHSYGPESRGGASRADVVISPTEIDYPRVERPDILIVLSREAYQRFSGDLRPGGTLIGDDAILTGDPPAGLTTYALPIAATARDLGSARAANVVALGVLCAVTEIIDRDAFSEALAAHRRGQDARNVRALQAGFSLGGGVAARPAPVGSGGPP